LTAEEDLARIVALTVSRPERFGDVRIFGSELSTKELCEIYNMAFNQNCQPKCLGSIDDLKQRICEKDQQDYDMRLLCGFLLPVFDGRGRIKENNNMEFNEIKLMNVEEFLKNNLSKGSNYQFPWPELSQKFSEICQK